MSGCYASRSLPTSCPHVQLATDETDFDKKVGTAIAIQQLHEHNQGALSFFSMQASVNAEGMPPLGWTEFVSLSAPSVTPRCGDMSMEKKQFY